MFLGMVWSPEIWEAEMGEEGRGSIGLSLGSIINPISPGAAKGELAGLPVPVRGRGGAGTPKVKQVTSQG